MTPKYIKDLHAYIESIPYGQLQVKIERVNRKTVKIETAGKETLRYTDTKAALNDALNILQGLVDTKYTGNAHIEARYIDGEINLLVVHDEKQTKY